MSEHLTYSIKSNNSSLFSKSKCEQTSSNKIIGFFFNSLIKKLQCAKIINNITVFCCPVENWLILKLFLIL